MVRVGDKVSFDPEVMERVLAREGLDVKANADALAKIAKKSSEDTYLSERELVAALPAYLEKLHRPSIDLKGAPGIKSTLDSPPASLKGYSFQLSDLDGNRHKDLLSINPVPLRRQQPSHGPLRAMAHSRGANVNLGHTRWGGITLNYTDKVSGEQLDFNKAKFVTGTFRQMLAGRADAAKQLEKLKDAGFSLSAERQFLVLNIQGNTEPIIIALRDRAGAKDRRAKIDEEDLAPRRSRAMPGFILPSWYDKRDYGAAIISPRDICPEGVQVENFGDRQVVTIKKPVIYVYPEKKTNVTVSVVPNGEFSAQYPVTENGTWQMVATPDGTLFDPRTEKKYSYLFWEAENDGTLELDETKAFCVKGDATPAFLEDVCNKYALTDRERTDFVSFWVPALMRNRYNVIQFFDASECADYAKMTVEPKPDVEIRLFMLFYGAPEPVKTGNPTLTQLKRGRFTVVEWGGANLDE
jgi:hypothetical protein